MTTPTRAALTTEHKASIVLLMLLPVAAMPQEDEPEFTDDFPVEECTFTPFGGNELFSLMPGRRTYFDNSSCVATGECEEREDLVITVTPELKKIWIDDDDGERRPVWTRVVIEHEREDGEIKEISRNYFAMCASSRDVYYFGEDVDIYAGGKVVSHAGAWLAGRHRAQPGIIMPDSAFILGQRLLPRARSRCGARPRRARRGRRRDRSRGRQFRRLRRGKRDDTARGGIRVDEGLLPRRRSRHRQRSRGDRGGTLIARKRHCQRLRANRSASP
jgi:hypothetical protein